MTPPFVRARAVETPVEAIQVGLGDVDVERLDALVRWRHPARGMPGGLRPRKAKAPRSLRRREAFYLVVLVVTGG
jgi:hypothetical protein